MLRTLLGSVGQNLEGAHSPPLAQCPYRHPLVSHLSPDRPGPISYLGFQPHTLLEVVESLLVPTTPEQVLEPMLTIINLLLQLRVLQQKAAPQAANQWATLLEWEVYSPTSVNLTIYRSGSQPLIISHYCQQFGPFTEQG